MGHFLGTLFDWPNGIVVGNLIASAICFSIAVFHLDRLARRHHAAMKAHITMEHEKTREATDNGDGLSKPEHEGLGR